jgi:hypothetical protein
MVMVEEGEGWTGGMAVNLIYVDELVNKVETMKTEIK